MLAGAMTADAQQTLSEFEQQTLETTLEFRHFLSVKALVDQVHPWVGEMLRRLALLMPSMAVVEAGFALSLEAAEKMILHYYEGWLLALVISQHFLSVVLSYFSHHSALHVISLAREV